jgi:hypothetical protein
MKRQMVAFWVVACVSLATCGVLFAHHGNAAYDLDKSVTLKGTITNFDFSNPHVQIFFDTKDDKGNVTHWSCESTNPAMLMRNGWSRNVLKPGDEVTMVVNPNKKADGTVVNLIKVVLAGGQELQAGRPKEAP